MTNCIGLVYDENDIELLGPIELGTVYDKTRQGNNVTDLPCAIYTEKNLSCWDRSDCVWSMMKSRQDNDMIDYTSTVYAKNETKLLWPIISSTVYD